MVLENTGGTNRSSNEAINGTLCFAVQWFWLFAIAPKALQLAIFFIFGIRLLWIAKDRMRITATFGLLLAWSAVYLLSAMSNAAETSSTERILATANTLGIWIVAILFTLSIQSSEKIDYLTIAKYSAINVVVLALFYAASSVLDLSFSLPWDGKDLWKSDWANGDRIARFTGLLGYSNSVVFVFLIFVPLSVPWLESKKSLVLNTLYTASSAYAALSCGSRAGAFIVLPLAALLWLHLLKNLDLSGKKNLIVCLAGFAICLPLLLDHWQEIAAAINSVFYGRIDSNSTRLNLYRNSVNEALTINPLFGLGIKNVESNAGIPLGSHSTYIGFLYRTGIVGSLIMVAALIVYCARKCSKGGGWTFMSIVWLLGFGAFIAIEDIDGLNWVLFYSFIFLQVLFRCDPFLKDGRREDQVASDSSIDASCARRKSIRCDYA